MLNDVLPFDVGDGEAPTSGGSVVRKPYAILYFMPRPPVLGSLGQPHEFGWAHWQITTVGETNEQVMFASGKVLHAMLDMLNGEYVNEITEVVKSRELLSGGGAARTSDNIFMSPDTYRLLID